MIVSKISAADIIAGRITHAVIPRFRRPTELHYLRTIYRHTNVIGKFTRDGWTWEYPQTIRTYKHLQAHDGYEVLQLEKLDCKVIWADAIPCPLNRVLFYTFGRSTTVMEQYDERSYQDALDTMPKQVFFMTFRLLDGIPF